jgi:hypothetical protein
MKLTKKRIEVIVPDSPECVYRLVADLCVGEWDEVSNTMVCVPELVYFVIQLFFNAKSAKALEPDNAISSDARLCDFMAKECPKGIDCIAAPFRLGHSHVERR